MQLGESGARIDDLCGQLRAGSEIFGDACDDESGGRVDNDDVARGAEVSLENSTDESCIFVRSTAAERFKGRRRDAKLLGSDDKASDAAIAHFRDQGFSRKRNFIQPVPMNDECALRAQFQQSRGYKIEGFRGKNAQQLPVCSGRIRERPQ